MKRGSTIAVYCSHSHRHRPSEDRAGEEQRQSVRSGRPHRVYSRQFHGVGPEFEGRRRLPIASGTSIQTSMQQFLLVSSFTPIF